MKEIKYNRYPEYKPMTNDMYMLLVKTFIGSEQYTIKIDHYENGRFVHKPSYGEDRDITDSVIAWAEIPF